MTLNLGESDMVAGDGSQDALEAVRRKRWTSGANDAVLIDARERFVSEYAYHALAANALYQGVYPLSAALSRPLIADLLVETAARVRRRRRRPRLHRQGQRSSPHRGRRARARPRTCAPGAAARAAALAARRDRLRAKARRADLAHRGQAVLRRRQPLGPLDRSRHPRDPWNAPPEDAYAWTVDPADRAGLGHEVVIAFHHGVPSMDGAQRRAIWSSSSTRPPARNGVGRIDIIEDRVVGLKSREVYECPGTVTLIEAHKALERLVLTRDELRLKAELDQTYGELIYDGQVVGAAAHRARRLQRQARRAHDGRGAVAPMRGRAVVTGSRSPFALYDESLATYGDGDRFRHDAAGRLHRDPRPAGRGRLGQAPREARDRSVDARRQRASAVHGTPWRRRSAVGRAVRRALPTRRCSRSAPRSKTIFVLAPFDVRCSRAHVAALEQAACSAARGRGALHAALDRVAEEIADGTFAAFARERHLRRRARRDRRAGARLAPARRRTAPCRPLRNDQVATTLLLYARDRARTRRALALDDRGAVRGPRGERPRATARCSRQRRIGSPPSPYCSRSGSTPRAQGFVRAAARFARVAATRRASARSASRRLPARRCRSTAPPPRANSASRTLAQRARHRRRPRRRARSAPRGRARRVAASRPSEEFVLWATPAFGYVRLDDAASTGSSLMPQKRNPDPFELVRAARRARDRDLRRRAGDDERHRALVPSRPAGDQGADHHAARSPRSARSTRSGARSRTSTSART